MNCFLELDTKEYDPRRWSMVTDYNFKLYFKKGKQKFSSIVTVSATWNAIGLEDVDH